MIAAIGTYRPPWISARSEAGDPRVAGSDEDVVTMAVAAGLAAMTAAGSVAERVRAVVLVSREPPLLEGGNGAALLAGLDLGGSTSVREVLGGAPAALEVVASAPDETLVIAADMTAGAGAAAAWCDRGGADLTTVGRVNRSLPVVTRTATGERRDYADPRLLRELGTQVAMERLRLAGDVAVRAIAGVAPKEAVVLADGSPPRLPTLGASAAIFALAAVAEDDGRGCVLALEQATAFAAELGDGEVAVGRNEPPARSLPETRMASDADIAISLAAYSRAFDAKLRLEAARCTVCGTLSYPHRFRCLECGAEEVNDVVALPRDAEVYTMATIHVPVPGLATPYTVVLAELGDSGVRLLAPLTGVPPGSIAIGDHGSMVFRRVGLRSGVPDYGYAFRPAVAA